jgi:DNA-binding transcriptional LysR family regulator
MDIRDLNLNLLLVLDTLFEEGTLTRAAQRLRLSQPTMSASLSKLRQALGDELFVRANGVMQPTARAISLRPAVASVLKTIRRDILSQAAFDPASETGVVTLSLSDIGELEFLPRLLARLSIEAPGVTLRAVVERPHKLSVSMDLGEVDLAIGYFPDLVTSSFKQQSLFRHPSACLVRRNHPSVGPDMSLEDYLGARHITVAQEGRTHDVVELGLSAAGLQRNIGLQISHFVSVPFLVAQSDMVATIPRPLAVKFAGVCDLLIVEPPFPIPLIEVKQLWHKRFDGHPRLRWLRQLVADISQNKPSLGTDADGAAPWDPHNADVPPHKPAIQKQY